MAGTAHPPVGTKRCTCMQAWRGRAICTAWSQWLLVSLTSHALLEHQMQTPFPLPPCLHQPLTYDAKGVDVQGRCNIAGPEHLGLMYATVPFMWEVRWVAAALSIMLSPKSEMTARKARARRARAGGTWRGVTARARRRQGSTLSAERSRCTTRRPGACRYSSPEATSSTVCSTQSCRRGGRERMGELTLLRRLVGRAELHTPGTAPGMLIIPTR